MGKRRVAALTVLLATGAGMLTGCSGTSQAASSPSASVTPSVMPSAVTPSTPATPKPPVLPVMPAAAKQHTGAGAQAFVAYYWSLLGYAAQTGDLRTADLSAAKGCKSCDEQRQVFSDIYANRRPLADPVSLSLTAKPEHLSDGSYAIRYAVVSPAGDYRLRDGTTLHQSREVVPAQLAIVAWDEKGWYMVRYGKEDK